MRAALPDRLSDMLTRLKLIGIRDQLDGLLESNQCRRQFCRKSFRPCDLGHNHNGATSSSVIAVEPRTGRGKCARPALLSSRSQPL
jgi:hypothetical protein